MKTYLTPSQTKNFFIKEAFGEYRTADVGTQTSPLQPLEKFFLHQEFWGKSTIEEKGPFQHPLEFIKSELIFAYQKALSRCNGVFRAFVKFSRPDTPEHGILDCDLYFLVSRSLYFNIDELYQKTEEIRDYFEDQLDVNIFYHYKIYHGQNLEEEVQEEAREIYFEPEEISTASQLQDGASE
ncbi:MAG: hypothetical protein D6681_20565 [Calditrichaeota bacterium]|nr:MAG: hypothetical protein D6681_20565 [Calditrichota bacterium]